MSRADEARITNEMRAGWAHVGIQAFKREVEMEGEEDDVVLGDFLVDLMHYADLKSIDFKQVLRKAIENYTFETRWQGKAASE